MSNEICPYCKSTWISSSVLTDERWWISHGCKNCGNYWDEYPEYEEEE